MKKILFASSEVHPLIKTGGLADVSGSLPKALKELHQDVRIIMPGYPSAMEQAGKLTLLGRIQCGTAVINLLEGLLPESAVPVIFVVHPESFQRAGNPYLATDGTAWPDNAERFALFSKAAVEVSMNRAGITWQPDIVHCNDWQTGLIPALLSLEYQHPPTLFTVHNLAYQGIFSAETFHRLGLPQVLWNHHGLEFHHQLSFMKGGLVYANRITTVSPTYAEEIQHPEFGAGLDGLLTHRRNALSGILNGIDTNYWNPETDPLITKNYTISTLEDKTQNKKAILNKFGMQEHKGTLLIGLVGRLVQQKGIDLVLAAMPHLMKLPIQLIILGSGNMEFEQHLQNLTQHHPNRFAVKIGYDETLSHEIEAGSDLFLMPSRFEPCGLNQMYSQRYGTLPLVRDVGGLADTVIDAMPTTISDGIATGFCFRDATVGGLVEALKRALLVYASPEHWRQMQVTGMSKDFSWTSSASQYIQTYRNLTNSNVQTRSQSHAITQPT